MPTHPPVQFPPFGTASSAGPHATTRVLFEERYKQFRNQVRKFSLNSIVQQTLRITALPPDDIVEALQRLPWLPMLIVKWALLDRMVYTDVGLPMSQQQLTGLVNELWNFDSDLVKPPRPETAHLLIRPRVFVQAEFQRGPTYSFLRIPALLARLPPEHSLLKLFEAQWGVTPEQFSDLATALLIARLGEGKPGFTREFFAPLSAEYGNEPIDKILRMFARDISGLREELVRSELKEDGVTLMPRRRSELLEFPYFKRFPLLKTNDDTYFVWHPTVLARALDEAVHLRFSDAGEAYTRPFSKVFEDYVVEIAHSVYPNLRTEADIKAARGPTSKAVEAIIHFQSCTVLVEAKMGLYPDEVITLSVPDLIRHKFRDLRKAVDQGATVAEMLHTGTLQLDGVSPTETYYLLVVTSRDMYLGRGEVLDAMCQPTGIAYPTDSAKRLLPLAHVFYLSIDSFEHLLADMKSGNDQLPKVLEAAVERNRNPVTASYWLEPHGKRAVVDDNSLVTKAWEASFARLEKALGGHQEETNDQPSDNNPAHK